ncbi:rhomboid family intramembrane serine protease GlpG [Cognaticolwellia mytili]|uniref:rhomboid family intramembrane serine protease GlpG n=1 Tax=Cognaticolwellia mytili TaxID=1888913 RepID=UPI001F231E04|nr:rhomboid family intramembrane serine protease GlpG [Cognaticolwellia mytili]
MMTEDLRPLVSVQHHNIVLLFCDYIRTLEIKAQIITEGDDFVIYCSQDKYDLARTEFKQFIEQPHHAKYQQAAWKNGNVTDVNSGSPALFSSFKEQFFAHAGLITLIIFGLCWLVFIASELGWARAIFNQLQFYPQLTLEQIMRAPHRLLGPALFHFSWLHIVFNTMWWWQLGGSIEKIFGKASLLKLFLATALASNVGQFMVDGPSFGGLSGVVYGLVGYVWWLGWLMPEKGLSLSKPIIGFMLFWLLLGYTSILPFNIANTAHLLGLVSGCCLAYIKVLKEKKHAS